MKTLAPGPYQRFGFNVIPGFSPLKSGNLLEEHQRNATRYGDIVRHRMGPLVVHVLRHPDHIKYVLQENHENYHKGRGIKKMKAVLGEGLLTSDGDLWKREHRLAQPAFHRQRLAQLAATMVGLTAEMLDRWSRGRGNGAEPTDIHTEASRLTLNIAASTLFNVDVSHETSNVRIALATVIAELNRRLFRLFDPPEWFPTPNGRAFRLALQELDRIVYGIIETRRRQPSDRPDLLGMLLEAKDEETGESMSDEQVRNETMTLFLAGHESTANALAWTWYLLSLSPGETRRVEREVDSVLGGRLPTFDDLAKLRHTRAVVDEALRIYPPVWLVTRTPLRDDVIGGFHVPKGSLVVVSPYLAHRHPAFWSNPEGFDPDRFLGDEAKNRHKYAYIPFGGGPRICIGGPFALMEATFAVAMAAQRFRLELAPAARVEPHAYVTMRPRGAVPMHIRAR